MVLSFHRRSSLKTGLIKGGPKVTAYRNLDSGLHFSAQTVYQIYQTGPTRWRDWPVCWLMIYNSVDQSQWMICVLISQSLLKVGISVAPISLLDVGISPNLSVYPTIPAWIGRLPEIIFIRVVFTIGLFSCRRIVVNFLNKMGINHFFLTWCIKKNPDTSLVSGPFTHSTCSSMEMGIETAQLTSNIKRLVSTNSKFLQLISCLRNKMRCLGISSFVLWLGQLIFKHHRIFMPLPGLANLLRFVVHLLWNYWREEG